MFSLQLLNFLSYIFKGRWDVNFLSYIFKGRWDVLTLGKSKEILRTTFGKMVRTQDKNDWFRDSLISLSLVDL